MGGGGGFFSAKYQIGEGIANLFFVISILMLLILNNINVY